LPPFLDPNVFAQLMNARMGMAPPPRTQASTSTAAGTSAPANVLSQNQPAGQTSATTPNLPPFMAPMAMAGFPFSPPPFGIPPPMPPPNFSGLTTEELKAMEGNERENIEARVKCLRNVQVLLDAAVMEMQQYTLVVSKLNTSTQAGPSSSTMQTESKKNETKEDNSNNVSATLLDQSVSVEEAGKFTTPEETGTKPKVKQGALSSSDNEKEDIIAKMDSDIRSSGKTSATIVPPTQETTIASADSSETNELRRLRLAKFAAKEKPNEGSN